MMRRLLLALVVVLAPAAAHAAQIVALDLKAVGGVPPRLAEALNPVLLTELSRREGMSVVSQADVRALLELEADKALLGCTDTSCMTDIAGSLGAELLATTTLSKVGSEYVVAMTLIQVEGAKVVRRSTGKARGGDEAASQALVMAVHELFRGELPTDLQGPASLSRRGFDAALAGLHKAIADPKVDPKSSRKRVILDIVHTELDYDAEPKLQALEMAIRRGRYDLRRRALASKNEMELEHWIAAIDQYRALWDDMGRVKEIRTRARERGIEPSARALRFLDPEPGPRPDPADAKRYFERSKAARAVVEKAMRAYSRDQPEVFARYWTKDRARNALSEYESGRRYDKEKGYRWDVLPTHAYLPELVERGVSSLKDGRVAVFVRRFDKDGNVGTEETVWLVEEDGQWRITSW